MNKKILIILSLLVIQPVMSQVYVNKGPAFISSEKFAGGFTQKAVIGLYAAWNLSHFDVNYLKASQVKLKFKIKNEDNALLDNRKLTPLDLTTNALTFSYKDKNNNYQNWKFIGVDYGYCHGMTMVNRQFIYFAEFNPTLQIPEKIKNNKRSLRAYFRKKIDQVMASKPTQFPSFKNLSDLSDSEYSEYLQRHVADQWGINTAQFNLYLKYRNWQGMDQIDVQDFTARLDYYLAKGFFPRVIIGEPIYTNENPHVVMITSYTKEVSEDDLGYCLRLNYFNVGTKEGGHITTAPDCIGLGSNLIVPQDEDLYFKNIMSNSSKLAPFNIPPTISNSPI